MAPKCEDDNHQQPNACCPDSVRTLPTEIIVEILLKKVPVKTLLRCKSVCKLWCSLISDPHFVNSHLTANNLYAHRRLIFKVGGRPNYKTCDLYDVMDDNSVNKALEVVDYPSKSTCRLVRVFGSCNGLLCLYIDDDLCLWNPSTRESFILPSGGYEKRVWQQSVGFGYDTSTNDYKVVKFIHEFKERDIVRSEVFVKIYSLGNGSWKNISAAFPYSAPYDSFATLFNGALHWKAGNSDGHLTIVSLDLATETFGEVMQPVYDEGTTRTRALTLGSLGDWFCLSCDYHNIRVDLWAMKVYGVKDSWTKLFSVPYMPDPGIPHCLDPLCISNDGRIFFSFERKLRIYDSKNSTFLDVQNFDGWVQASTFVESLVSPMPTALEHRVSVSIG